jgi:drug/metabolite transporter (DMT)-like permease
LGARAHTLAQVIAALLALLSALSFATSTVVQHRAATTAGGGNAGAVQLFLKLLRTRAWLAGQCTAAIGFILHGLALRSGPVVIVQPLLSSGLVLTLVLGFLVDRRHPGRPLPSRAQWVAAAVVVIGLVLFLPAAHPRHGAPTGRPLVLLLASTAALGAAGIAVWWSHNPQRPHRALALGIAAGCGFGITGTLLKQVVRHAPTTWSTIWPLLLMVVVGVTSIILAQSAYQAGALIESLPSLTVLEPVVAVVVASRAYGEHLHSGWLHHTGQTLGLVLLAVGVIGIARAETNRHTILS